MSTQAVTEFWGRIDSDKVLQAKFLSHKEMTIAEIVDFAHAHGFQFTEAEMKEVAGRVAVAGSAELSDRDLQGVVGGAGAMLPFSSSRLQSSFLKGGIGPIAI